MQEQELQNPPLLPTMPGDCAPPETLDGLAESIGKLTAHGVSLHVAAECHGYQIGRLIALFSERPEIAAQVAELNAKRKSRKGGRPKEPHCHVAELLAPGAEPLVKVRKDWLEKCARAYLRDRDAGFVFAKNVNKLLEGGFLHSSAENPLAVPVDRLLPDADRVIPGGVKKSAGSDPDALGPDKIAERIARAFEKHFIRNGHIRIPGRHEQTAILTRLEGLLEKLGWELKPIGRN